MNKAQTGKPILLPIEISPEAVNMRIDRALAQTLSDWSRSGIGELIQGEAVFLNGRPVKKGAVIISTGDQVAVDEKKMTRIKELRTFAQDAEGFTTTGSVSAVVPEDIPLDIVYEDNDLLVVDKPVGMVVHPAYANTSGTLANAIAGYFVRKGIPLFRRIGLVHRLDKDVGGLIAVAKNDDALRELSEQFSGEGIRPGYADTTFRALKVYWAVVGPISDEILRNSGLGEPGIEKTVEGYIWRSPKERKKSVFVEGSMGLDEGGVKKRYALSRMKYKKPLGDGRHLLEVQIVTGRTHQIRAQLASMQMPIYGDVMYNGEKRDRKGMGLRCVSLSLIPPGVYLEMRKGRNRERIIKRKKALNYKNEVEKGENAVSSISKLPQNVSIKDKSNINRLLIEKYVVP